MLERKKKNLFFLLPWLECTARITNSDFNGTITRNKITQRNFNVTIIIMLLFFFLRPRIK